MIKINKYMAVITLFYTGVSLATKPSGDLVVSTNSLRKSAQSIGHRGPVHLKRLKSWRKLTQQFLEVPLKSLQGYGDTQTNLDPEFSIPSHRISDYIKIVRALTTRFQSLPTEIRLQIVELYKNRLAQEDTGVNELGDMLSTHFQANTRVYDFLQKLFQPEVEMQVEISKDFIKIFTDNNMFPKFFQDISVWYNYESVDLFSKLEVQGIAKWNPELAEKIQNIINAKTYIDTHYMPLGSITDAEYDHMSEINIIRHSEGIRLVDDDNKILGELSKEDIQFLRAYWDQVQAI